jgi:hypothetical protein
VSTLTRVADVIAALSEGDSVRMLVGVTAGTAGNVSVRIGTSTFKVKHWVNKPTGLNVKVLVLMQGGTIVAIGPGGGAMTTQDTGLLDVTAARGLDWTEGSVYVRRIGQTVYVTSYGLSSPDNRWFVPALEFPVPDGFTPAIGEAWTIPAPVWDGDTGGALTTTYLQPTDDPTYGWIGVFEFIGGTKVFGTVTYLTDDAWPATLPGSPVTMTLGRPRLGERGI